MALESDWFVIQRLEPDFFVDNSRMKLSSICLHYRKKKAYPPIEIRFENAVQNRSKSRLSQPDREQLCIAVYGVKLTSAKTGFLNFSSL